MAITLLIVAFFNRDIPKQSLFVQRCADVFIFIQFFFKAIKEALVKKGLRVDAVAEDDAFVSLGVKSLAADGYKTSGAIGLGGGKN
jgi:hypothetical protein